MTIKRTHKFFLPVIAILLAALVTVSPFAIDTFIAALPDMALDFGVDIGVMELTVTLYFLGFSVGNFIGGPMSDAFGRKTIALIGIATYAIAALIIPYSQSIGFLLAMRVIQAFGGGFATVTSNLFIRDWYEGKQVARLITIISMIILLAPLFAPVLGTALIAWKSWKTVFYFLFIFATTLFVVFMLVIPESRDKSLLTRKLTAGQLLGKYKDFFASRLAVITLFAISFPMSGMYLFIAASSFIYLKYFGIEQKYFPLVFGSNVLLNILLSLWNTFLLKKHRPKNILQVGLWLQLASALLLVLAVTVFQSSFWVFFVGIVIFIGSLGLVFGNGSAVILNHNPAVSGSANATIGITRFLLSALIGSLLALFHTGNLLPIAFTMFACSLIGNILYTYVMRLFRVMDEGS